MSEASGRPYVVAWLGLLALTGASFGSSFLPLGALSPVVAFAIALAKALVVVVVFMHLDKSSFATQMIALVNFLFVVLICLGVLADVALR